MRPLLAPDAAYALWADTYPPRAHNELMRIEERAMMRLWSKLRATRALDLGTGTGRNLELLAKEGTSRRIGLDRSRAMLERADAAGAFLVQGDAVKLPFASASFDLVLASLMAGDLAELSSFAGEAARVLRARGSLVYSDFHPTWSENGWERTFESQDGRSWKVPYHPHALSHHRSALRRAGFEVAALQEPLLGSRPVLVVVHAIRR
jgi:malonyl-CoA O-methyltransferase